MKVNREEWIVEPNEQKEEGIAVRSNPEEFIKYLECPYNWTSHRKSLIK